MHPVSRLPPAAKSVGILTGPGYPLPRLNVNSLTRYIFMPKTLKLARKVNYPICIIRHGQNALDVPEQRE